MEDASELYRARVESEIVEGNDAYNLGTALLAMDSPEAEEYLRFATEMYDSAAIQRGQYNLGRLFLLRAGAAPGPDVALAQLEGAVTSGRVALRGGSLRRRRCVGSGRVSSERRNRLDRVQHRLVVQIRQTR